MTGWLMLRAKRNANPSASTRHTNAPTRNGSPFGGTNCSRTVVPLRSHILGATFAPCALMSTAWHGWRRFPTSTSTGHATRVRGYCRRSRWWSTGLRPSLDHLFSAQEDRLRDGNAEFLSGLEVDEQLGFRGLLDRQVRRLLALENPAGVDACHAVRVRNAASVAHQAAGRGELAILVDRGHRVADRQGGEVSALGVEECIGADDERAGPKLGQS